MTDTGYRLDSDAERQATACVLRIRELAAQRRIAAINLWPALSGKWQANISADRVSWTIGLDDDPVAALEKALVAFGGKFAAAVAADLEDMLG